MSSPPPTPGREQITDVKAPRPHAADTTVAGVNAGGVQENQAAPAVELKATICPGCMEPWSCDDPHRICCIPCGHVYGRSCMEKLLHRSGQNSAKCPQCGKHFMEEFIINLYAPENMLEGCCSHKEIQAFYEDILAAVRAHSEPNVPKEASNDSKSIENPQKFREWVAQMERTVNEKVRMAKANLMLMKERLKKMAEQEKMVPRDVIEFMEQNCPHLIICMSSVFSASPAPGMEGGEEVANVEIVVREEAASEGGEYVEANAPAGPTCSICMESWTCAGEHHICCISCGHVYGWSCIIRWIRDTISRNEDIKCPQCWKQIEGYPINLNAPFCQEVHEYYEAKFAEFGASREECTLYAKLHSQDELLSAQAKHRDELRPIFSSLIVVMELEMMEHLERANASLWLMKERMKKMAEEDMATTQDLVGYMELNCPQASTLSYPTQATRMTLLIKADGWIW